MTIKVLVADDSPTIRRRAQATLQEAGYEVTCVADGQAAWDLLRAGQTPDVILCDILMPQLDGYELCRIVKADSRSSHVPVMLLRGTFEPWNQEKAEAVGADGFIAKPFEAEALIGTLSELLGSARDAAPAAAKSAPTGAPGALVDEQGAEPLAAAAEEGPLDVAGEEGLAASTMAIPAFRGDMDAPAAPEALPPPADVEPEPLEAADAMGEPFGGADDPLALGLEEPAAVAETVAPARPAAARPAAPPIAAGGLDDAALDELAQRLVRRLALEQVEKIAWEVVPEVAEAMIRKRILEIESKLSGG
jgi:CheY-like chemotaxis protein